MNRLLVIIVTYNAMRWVDRCLGSVTDSTVKADLFVVDNGSTDGTRDYIAEHYPEAILVRSEVNLKFGKGNNLGLEYALKNGYDYVYLLNQDAWVMPDTFEKMIVVQKKHPEFGLLSPLQLSSNGESYEQLFEHLVVENLPDDYRGHELCEITFAQAAHWLISKSCIEIVGGFSPTFPHYGEDDNYCQRVLYHGFKIGVVPSAKGVHDSANRPPMSNKQKCYRHYIRFALHLSDVTNESDLLHRLFFVMRRAKGLAVEDKSLTSFGGLFKTMLNIIPICRNKKITKEEQRAFLNN